MNSFAFSKPNRAVFSSIITYGDNQIKINSSKFIRRCRYPFMPNPYFF